MKTGRREVGGRRRASDGKASAARPRRNSFGVSATSAELFKRARNCRRRRHFGTLDTAMRDSQAVVHAYRHFYRQGLKAIHYSTPSRHILVKTLRSSFRSSSPDDFNPQRVSNTLRFLQRATDVAGIEHKILKNLMITRYWEQPHTMKNARIMKGVGVDDDIHTRKDIREQFELTLMLLNESLGTCLR